MVPETRHFVAANVIFRQYKDFFESEASFMKEARSLLDEVGGVVHNKKLFLPGRGRGRRYQLKDAFKLMANLRRKEILLPFQSVLLYHRNHEE